MLAIIRCDEKHPLWKKVVAYHEKHELSRASIDKFGRFPRCGMLAAVVDGVVVGVLSFIVQPIGPEMDAPIFCDKNGLPLYEAKVRRFYVDGGSRGRGIGKRLQEELLKVSAEMGIFQVRSYSKRDRNANYAIKQQLGFAAHPVYRGDRNGNADYGIYWVKQV